LPLGLYMAMDLASLRSRLEQEQERLTDELKKLVSSDFASAGSRGSWFGQRDEQANQSAEFRRQESSERQLREHLARVTHALQKLDRGTYSLCDNCGQPIALERLEALPYAALCLNCQAKKKG